MNNKAFKSLYQFFGISIDPPLICRDETDGRGKLPDLPKRKPRRLGALGTAEFAWAAMFTRFSS